MTSPIDHSRHPCFNAKVKGRYGRVHLPVAPRCTIQCNYCNRRYDCVNESRPGVTSTLLSPGQALKYMEKVLAREPRISVAGIAGPGDPFANPDETMQTMRLIRGQYPDIILCLATNGMNLSPYVSELAEIGVSHVTVTVNAVDPDIAKEIYSWVREGKIVYRGRQAAELLLARQIGSIEALKRHGITVKVNTIVIPGVNDHHVPDVARTMQELGVDLLNCMAMHPNADTPFAGLVEPTPETMAEIRARAEKFLPQMRHCTRCRADAVGLLDDDRTDELRGCLSACSSLEPNPEPPRPYVAVATLEGVLVNQHLGEAIRFQVWQQDVGGGYSLVEERPAPPPGSGSNRWHAMARILGDCRAILVSDLGETPRSILNHKGIRPVTMTGFIEQGLRAVYTGKGLHTLQGRGRSGLARQGCAGGGGGCG